MSEKNQFLIDENLSPKLTDVLRQLGHIAKHCRELQLIGKTDLEITEWAVKKNVIIITGDREFGELWYWYYSGKLGIIVLCLSSQSLEGQKKDN